MVRRIRHHVEHHFSGSETVRDVVIGMADGLTVPFALAAGLSGAVASTHIVIVGGLAEIAAGAIAMGLGGYLAARSDTDHYESERQREVYEIEHMPVEEREEINKIFKDFGLSGEALKTVVDSVIADKDRWIDVMMRLELGLERPDPKRAPISAMTIGGSYIIGGFVPLISYFFMPDMQQALILSVALTAFALFVFGGIKAKLIGMSVIRGALQTLAVGGLAAAVAFGVAKLIS